MNFNQNLPSDLPSECKGAVDHIYFDSVKGHCKYCQFGSCLRTDAPKHFKSDADCEAVCKK